MNVIIVTACPSGVATTFLAARGLERAAARRGWKAAVEMHSQLQPLVPADAATLASAGLVIIAASAPVELTRFVGKRVYQGSIAQAAVGGGNGLPDAHGRDHGGGHGASAGHGPGQPHRQGQVLRARA